MGTFMLSKRDMALAEYCTCALEGRLVTMHDTNRSCTPLASCLMTPSEKEIGVSLLKDSRAVWGRAPLVLLFLDAPERSLRRLMGALMTLSIDALERVLRVLSGRCE